MNQWLDLLVQMLYIQIAVDLFSVCQVTGYIDGDSSHANYNKSDNFKQRLNTVSDFNYTKQLYSTKVCLPINRFLITAIVSM